MITLDLERAHLAKAELDIAKGEKRIAAQALRIREMQSKGRDTLAAEQLLAILQATLVQWCAHREEIRLAIRRLQTP